ncbi:ABC transporter permease [Solicola gregarius]|uniref:ABC transporter permease n=1 Tax=Solicola gregarius TaxID=2908642 RepID=A0AA46TGP2_9ACTN|nr:ABC transporter permease [Solicola gregarius]UYM05032.1 ABC transporter permease [Solicola gregarius]
MGMWSRLTSPIRQTSGMGRWVLLSGIIIVAFFVILAIFANWIAPYGFAQNSADGVDFPQKAPPGGDHLMGTDGFGYDVWSRVIFGSRTALLVIVLAVLGSLVLGLILGLISGYVGGWLDRILVLIMDALYAFPSLLLAIVVGFLLSEKIGAGVASAALALTVVYMPQYFRVVRNSTVSAREATYVEAARAIGAPGRTVITRYLFGNVIQSVPVIGTLNASDALSTLAALGFLGLGIQPSDGADWGYDLSAALEDAAAGIWWTGVFPGLAIVLLIVGLTLVGEGLNETINPTLRKRRLKKITAEETGK